LQKANIFAAASVTEKKKVLLHCRQVSGYSCHSLDAVPGFGLREIVEQKSENVFLVRKRLVIFA
jgi:hypothetical protein